MSIDLVENPRTIVTKTEIQSLAPPTSHVLRLGFDVWKEFRTQHPDTSGIPTEELEATQRFMKDVAHQLRASDSTSTRTEKITIQAPKHMGTGYSQPIDW